MRSIKAILSILILSILISGCKKDNTTESTTFSVSFTNSVDLLASHVFNTPIGATEPGPITIDGGAYEITFSAVPGSKLSFATMQSTTNDWFFAPDENGIALFDATGNPITGDITGSVHLYDAGTEEEDPATVASEPNGATAGSPDDDNTVRLQQQDISSFLTANLSYANDQFTLTLTRNQDGRLTPGIVVIHAQNNPLFELGEADRGEGLEAIAEAGNPTNLSGFLNETGTDGAPIRLSAATSPFSPGVIYAFYGDEDPVFTQGEAVTENNGLEELAESGNNQLLYDYIKGLGLPVAKSTETTGVGPNSGLNFELEVPKGYRLGLATMFVQSNDWIVAFNNAGATLFDAGGNPVTGSGQSTELYLFDVGTEADEAVGFGANQAPRQATADSGAPDPNSLIRRVTEINNVQFGRGVLTSTAGVVSAGDARGGYNLVVLEVE